MDGDGHGPRRASHALGNLTDREPGAEPERQEIGVSLAKLTNRLEGGDDRRPIVGAGGCHQVVRLRSCQRRLTMLVSDLIADRVDPHRIHPRVSIAATGIKPITCAPDLLERCADSIMCVVEAEAEPRIPVEPGIVLLDGGHELRLMRCRPGLVRRHARTPSCRLWLHIDPREVGGVLPVRREARAVRTTTLNEI